jgi:hypothetical protein
MDAIGALVFVSLLVIAPLLAREWKDRRDAQALRVRADVQSTVNRKLGGDSFVSVRVTPASWRRPGRVELSAPSGWEWLVDEVWRPALRRVPANYELVVKPGPGVPARTGAALKTAA